MSDCHTAFKEWCDKWDVETDEERQNFWMDGFNDAADAGMAIIRAQSNQIDTLTKERIRAYQSLQIIHTWAKCWNGKYESAESSMMHIVSMCDKGLGKPPAAKETNE